MSQTYPKIAIFPGTFDPVTLGHLDVIQRGRRLFDQLIIALGRNPAKEELFPMAERLEMLRELIADYPDVTVEAYEGLTVELVKRRNAVAILRGLRNMTDLDYEFRIALTNRAVAQVETVFIMTSEQFGFTSSSLIKEIACMGVDLNHLSTLLPANVITRLKHYRESKIGIFNQIPKDHLH